MIGGTPGGSVSITDCSNVPAPVAEYTCFDVEVDEATRKRIQALEDEVTALRAAVAAFERQLDVVMASQSAAEAR